MYFIFLLSYIKFNIYVWFCAFLKNLVLYLGDFFPYQHVKGFLSFVTA